MKKAKHDFGPIGLAFAKIFSVAAFCLAGVSLQASSVGVWDGESGAPASHSVDDEGGEVEVTSHRSYQGGKALKAHVGPNTNASEDRSGFDRSEFRMSECSADMFDSPRYIGFAIYFDGDVDQPLDAKGNWLSFHQWRQCTSRAIPPINFGLQKGVTPPDGKVAVQLSIRADGDAINGGQPSHQYKTILDKNRWYRVALGAKVDPSGDGFVRLWIDEKQVADFSGSIGQSELAQEMEIKCGIYRGGGVPLENGADTIYFDEVRYGDSYAAVDPGQDGE